MLVGHKEHEDPQSSGFPLVLSVSFCGLYLRVLRGENLCALRGGEGI